MATIISAQVCVCVCVLFAPPWSRYNLVELLFPLPNYAVQSTVVSVGCEKKNQASARERIIVYMNEEPDNIWSTVFGDVDDDVDRPLITPPSLPKVRPPTSQS